MAKASRTALHYSIRTAPALTRFLLFLPVFFAVSTIAVRICNLQAISLPRRRLFGLPGCRSWHN